MPRTGTTSWRHTFTYDQAGNRRTKEDQAGVTTYTYDTADRLLSSDDSSGRTTYVYNANGNQVSKEEPSGDVTTFAWDYENLLVQAETPDNEVSTYTWNAGKQRVAKESDTGSVKFLWDGQSLLQEYDEFDLTQAHCTLQPAPQPYPNLVSQHRDTDSTFHHFDALGNTQALTAGWHRRPEGVGVAKRRGGRGVFWVAGVGAQRNPGGGTRESHEANGIDSEGHYGLSSSPAPATGLQRSWPRARVDILVLSALPVPGKGPNM